MVIIRTSAVEVSIQAVSPVSILKAGAAEAAGAVLVVAGAAAGAAAEPVAFTAAVGLARLAAVFCARAP
jgi:glutamate synthase domain-containing protein 2